MREINYTARFKKDIKVIKKQSFYDKKLLEDIIKKLANDTPLEEKYRDHALQGKYEGSRECHIKPDWLLIYVKSENRLTLSLSRTGTHSDLF